MGKLLYTLSDNCPAPKVFWLPDNESVIFMDCSGNLIKFNTSSGTKQTITNFIYNLQLNNTSSFYTRDLPDKLFFIGVSTHQEYNPELYSYNFDTHDLQVILHDSLDPSLFSNMMGNTHLGMISDDTLIIIDLVQASTQPLAISDAPVAWSPDDNEILFFSRNESDEITGAYTYDFTCQCRHDLDLKVFGSAIWRNEGLFGYVSGYYLLQFYELTTGDLLKQFSGGLPVLDPKGTMAVMITPDSSETYRASLKTFDLITKQSRILNTYDSFCETIEQIAVSPDQKRIVFVFSYCDYNDWDHGFVELRMIDLTN
jgi:hypothetical protein